MLGRLRNRWLSVKWIRLSCGYWLRLSLHLWCWLSWHLWCRLSLSLRCRLLRCSSWVVRKIYSPLRSVCAPVFALSCAEKILELCDVIVVTLGCNIQLDVHAELINIAHPRLGGRTAALVETTCSGSCIVHWPVVVGVLISHAAVSCCEWILATAHLHGVEGAHVWLHAHTHRVHLWLLRRLLLRLFLHVCHDLVESAENVIGVDLFLSSLLLLLLLLLLHLLLLLCLHSCVALLHRCLHLCHHWVDRLLLHHRISLRHSHTHGHLGLCWLLCWSRGAAHQVE